jgi:hypothetical protein
VDKLFERVEFERQLGKIYSDMDFREFDNGEYYAKITSRCFSSWVEGREPLHDQIQRLHNVNDFLKKETAKLTGIVDTKNLEITRTRRAGIALNAQIEELKRDKLGLWMLSLLAFVLGVIV